MTYDKKPKKPYLVNALMQSDERGFLTLIDVDFYEVPMIRHFFVGNREMPSKRGRHAHISAWQILCHLNHPVVVETKNVNGSHNFLLENNSMLVVPPSNWIELDFAIPNSSLLVLSSKLYDPKDYIYQVPSID